MPVKNRETFKSPERVAKERSMKNLQSPPSPGITPINKYIKAKAKSSMKKKHKVNKSKNIKKSKEIWLQNLKDFLEEQRKYRFKNVNINDVRELRRSWNPDSRHASNQPDSESEESSADSVKPRNINPTIEIGQLEDRVISQAKPMLK